MIRARSGFSGIFLLSGAATIAFGVLLTALTGSPLALLAVAFGAADVIAGLGLRWDPGSGNGEDRDPGSTSDRDDLAASNGNPYAE